MRKRFAIDSKTRILEINISNSEEQASFKEKKEGVKDNSDRIFTT
jgi:hypothetical protein